MVCIVEMSSKPKLNKPVLIEGLPGIGFIANIAALHLMKQLKAERFAEIHSSAFQDLAVTVEGGSAKTPINELYFHKSPSGDHDLIIWYGNTQALTTAGQYELCGRVLNAAEEMNCDFIVSLGGYRQPEIKASPQIFTVASDVNTVNKVLSTGAKIMVGQIFGVAGLLVGLARLRGFKSFSLLVETLGTSPDVNGAKIALSTLNKLFNMNVSQEGIDSARDETQRMLQSFGLLKAGEQEKKKDEQQFRWFI